MQVHNLEKFSTRHAIAQYNAYLVSAFVSNKHYERTMVLLDIVVDEDRDSGIQLFPH